MRLTEVKDFMSEIVQEEIDARKRYLVTGNSFMEFLNEFQITPLSVLHLDNDINTKPVSQTSSVSFPPAAKVLFLNYTNHRMETSDDLPAEDDDFLFVQSVEYVFSEVFFPYSPQATRTEKTINRRCLEGHQIFDEKVQRSSRKNVRTSESGFKKIPRRVRSRRKGIDGAKKADGKVYSISSGNYFTEKGFTSFLLGEQRTE